MRGIVWALAGVACLSLAGCGANKASSFKHRIAVVPKGLTHAHWQSVERGARRAAADFQEKGISVEILWDGPRTESDASAQIDILNRNIANRVSGIVLAPQHSQTMMEPVRTAVSKGIPVVVFDSGLDNHDLVVKYVATDNYHGGQLAAERLLKVLKDEGKTAPKLILFRYQQGSESTEQREKGFGDVINAVIEEQKKKGEPTITWLSTNKYAGATVDSALKEATPLLSNYRDRGIDGIFAPNESSASGMLKALQSLRLNKKVHLVGFDSSSPLLEAVADGDIEGLILQDPYRMGYLSVWNLVQHLEGYDVAPGGEKTQSTGEHLVTRDNFGATDTRELYDPALQEQRKFDLPTYSKKK